MLSTSHRFLFVHIPKTGGNSIQDALRDCADDAIVRLQPHHDGVNRFEVRSATYRTVKHSTIADYKREYGDALMATLFKFSCIRNSWDRCMSHYFSPHRGHVAWNKEEFIQFVKTEVHPVSAYLSPSPALEPLSSVAGKFDFLMKFENLQSDFEHVCDQLGLPQLKLQLRNASREAEHRRYYDRDTKQLVAEKFNEEIAYFGYSFH